MYTNIYTGPRLIQEVIIFYKFVFEKKLARNTRFLSTDINVSVSNNFYRLFPSVLHLSLKNLSLLTYIYRKKLQMFVLVKGGLLIVSA